MKIFILFKNTRNFAVIPVNNEPVECVEMNARSNVSLEELLNEVGGMMNAIIPEVRKVNNIDTNSKNLNIPK